MIRVRWLLLVVLAAVLAASCGGSDDAEPSKPRAPAASADAATARELQQVLDLQRESYGATGMAAAIVIDGQHFWSGGSGLADRETEAPITAGTPFPIFSSTKMFIAALAVKLDEDGRLKLDDPLSRTLPDWPNAEHISLRMLLNQTSGIGNDQRRLERDSEARPRKMWTPEESLNYAQRAPHAVGLQQAATHRHHRVLLPVTGDVAPPHVDEREAVAGPRRHADALDRGSTVDQRERVGRDRAVVHGDLRRADRPGRRTGASRRSGSA